MQRHHRDILQQMRKKIVDDLDVVNVVQHLKKQQVLRDEEIVKIERGQTKQKRAESLLDILPNCGPHAFDVFHNSLRYLYSWISEDMDEGLRRSMFDVIDMERSTPGSPNLPPQSPMTVIRQEKINQLKTALTNLGSGGYLVLHGMKGFGKSCLTANTLKDTSLVTELFTNQVYWIKFGYERSIDDEILIQLNFLYHQVRNADSLNSTLNSEPLKAHLIHYLRHHFSQRNHRNALLILDDIWSKDIIDAFNFHCKTLVITTDIGFLDGKQREIIEMNDGFTREESLDLFARSLGTGVDKLPSEARKIHEECNGMPILISMFAAHFKEFKDEMNMDSHKWRYYLQSLQNKDPTNRLVHQFLAKQDVIFDMCIDKLDDQMKEKYRALAIFSEDVNIMPKTLEILWDLDPLNKEYASHIIADDMLLLCHKSLAAKHWNVDLKSYVYGVHDLLLCHLRRKLSPDQFRGLHRSFIEKLRRYCGGDFSKLPKDNYTYSYIGHHLEQARMYSEFPTLFLDFDFLREKIYNTGLSDLLIDLKKYRKWITQKTEEGEAKVKDLETFLENQAGIIADHRRRECLDLVQIGLNHSSTGFVYQKCCELANVKSTNLYVIHDHAFGSMLNNGPNSEEVSTDVRTASFTNDWDKILIGNNTGDVVLWDCKTRGQNVFSGHDKKAILKIIVSYKSDYFLTLAEDGRVKLFAMKEDDNGTLTRVRSPQEKQVHWSALWSGAASKDNSNVTFSIHGEKITDMALCDNDKVVKKCVAVCTEKGTIQVLALDGVVIYTDRVENRAFGHIAFGREGSMLHLLDLDGVLILYLKRVDLSYSYATQYNLYLQKQKIILFQVIPEKDRSLMIVTDSRALHVTWCEHNGATGLVDQVYSQVKQERAVIEEAGAFFTCANLTDDGEYVITADSKGSINVWAIHTGTSPIATFKGRVNSLDTYWLGEEEYLICGSKDRVLHRWTLFLEQLPKSVRKPLFTAVMKPYGEKDIVAIETPNGIDVYNGEGVITGIRSEEGSIVRLSLDPEGNRIIYATDKGAIIEFDLKAKTSTTVKSQLIGTPGIVMFVTMNGQSVVVYGANNDLVIRRNSKIDLVLENVGHAIAFHVIDNEYAISVGRSGIVQFWNVTMGVSELIKRLDSCTENESLCYSCLSPNKKLLTVLKTNGEMTIYDIIRDDNAELATIDADIVVTFLFDQKVSCCEYSQDNNYLAIGLEHGDISIFDIFGRREVARLEFHCNEVRQLHWSPTSLGVPILLSVNCDELAWWNIAPLLSEKKETRRGRFNMSRSISNFRFSPRSSGRLSASQSLDSTASSALARELKLSLSLQPSNGNGMAEQQSDNHSNGSNGNCEPYWQNKTAENQRRKGLLAVVRLPPSVQSKVCVSDDFRKFLSVDIHGAVSHFRFFNDT